MTRFGREFSTGFLALGLISTLVFALQPGDLAETAAQGVVMLGCMVCLAIGPRMHRNRTAVPWRLMFVATLFFGASAVVRPWSLDQHGIAVASAELLNLVAFALLIATLVAMNRTFGRLDWSAFADGVIVSLGVGLLAIVAWVLPAIDISTRPAMLSLAAGLYPVIDVVLLLLLLNLAFTTTSRPISYRFFGLGMTALFVGDVGLAVVGVGGDMEGPPLLVVPYMLAYTFMGAAVIHPTMSEFGSGDRAGQPWTLPRLALIVPALLAPCLVVPVRSGDRTVQVLLIVAYAGLVLTLLLRAVSAVRGLARAQETLRYQATHDGLTGLPNRVELMDQVARTLADPRRDVQPVWLLFLDLDGFKLVNDSWGHETGDRLLREVAQRLLEVTQDATVARIGGDEFVIVARLSREEAVDLARRVQVRLREAIEVYSLDLVVTTSIGMATTSGDQDADALLRDADTAMYRAKARGRDGWMIFDDSMRQSVRDRVEIEVALRHSIPRGQLWVAYQPIVDIPSERVVGCEALLRWSHPDRGDISPVIFIPVAEETGMIVEIGAWVLEESIRQLAAWRERAVVDDGFFVSVNASARQLRDHDFVHLAGALLDDTGVPPERVVVEITESVILEQSELVSDVMGALRALGVRLSVDDFGTGYSSLTYLNRYPVTGVKVDRSFVDGLGGVPGDEAIVRAVTAMARALKLAVVAEGVETSQQRDILRGLGIRLAQGWLWGAAEQPGTFERLWGRAATAGTTPAPAPAQVPAQVPVSRRAPQDGDVVT